MNLWYLVYCKPNQEARAEQNLKRQGFEVFLPMIQKTNRRPGRAKTVREECLFPRYVFIQVDPETQSIAPVSSTLGVVNFVRFGKRYATASQALISEIRSYAFSQQETAQSQNRLKAGDKVVVDGHGFQQMKGIYSIDCGNSRAMILLDILGNQSRIKVPLECITKVDKDVA